MPDNRFLTIAITRESFFPKESEIINSILEKGEVDWLHIRKPSAKADQIEILIKNIDQKFHKRIKLHDHFELINKFDLGGVHLNSRNPFFVLSKEKSERKEYRLSISKSLHSLEELDNVEGLDYFFISPVFDSISKQGYKAAFNLNELSKNIKGKKAIALGGVTPDKIPLLKDLGFYGAALLSYYFPNN